MQEILCVGDPEVASSLGIARVTNTAPPSTNAALNVRIASGPSSVADLSVRSIAPSTYGDGGLFRVAQSTAGDLLASVAQNSTVWQVQAHNSTIGDLLASVQQNSTVWQVQAHNSSIGDLLASVQQNSTVWQVQAHNSSIGDLLASVQQNSTVWQVQAKIQDSSAVGFVGTTTRPTTGAQGLVTRQVLNDLSSTGASTVGQTSTQTTLVSSVASLRIKVYAYSVISTVITASTCYFKSSNTKNLWPMVLGTGSSGISGANLAVSPPGWLFATDAGEALSYQTPSSGPEFHVSVSYFTEA